MRLLRCTGRVDRSPSPRVVESRRNHDLTNGALLCTACHHRLHDEGWEITIDGVGVDALVWLIPPPWIDRSRTPRPGGRRRYTLTA
ncbi:hypothetical protein FHX68_2526 [Microbacterium lacticum]|uniref:HNH endonuclease n=1 Tax=Microbacterium lacticum TaxID=33885 RepID=A0A543K8E8_9MICO|nr:hypothetical protein FHX68_2526 [Microbacterium lacticum]